MEFFRLQVERGEQEGGWGIQLEFGDSLDPDSWSLRKWTPVGDLGPAVAEVIGVLSDWVELGPLGALSKCSSQWR